MCQNMLLYSEKVFDDALERGHFGDISDRGIDDGSGIHQELTR